MDYRTEVEMVLRSLSRPKAAALSVLCCMMWLKRDHGPIWETAELSQITGWNADAIGEGKQILLRLKLVNGAGAAGRYGLVLNDRAVEQLGLWDLAPVGPIVEQLSETGKNGVGWPSGGLRLVGEGELSTPIVESETGKNGVAGCETGKNGVTSHSSSSSCFTTSSPESETTTTTNQPRPEKPVSNELPPRYVQAWDVLVCELGMSRLLADEVARVAFDNELGGAWLEFQALRWLVYCCSPRGQSINNVPHFVAARLREGVVAPGFVRADSWSMKMRIDRLWEEVRRDETEVKTMGRPGADEVVGDRDDVAAEWAAVIAEQKRSDAARAERERIEDHERE
jgi:hypothetical protein